MKRLAIITTMLYLLLMQYYVKAEDYSTGLGIRLGGYTSGLTVKGFLNSRGALEGIAGFGKRSFVVTGLYEHHFPITNAEGLSLYAGGGGHFGFFGHNSSYLVYRHKNETVYVVDEGNTAFVPGIDGVFGIEYKFQGAPFTVGADIKPFLDFYDGTVHYIDGALNLRWVF